MRNIKKFITIIFTTFLVFGAFGQSVDATTQILETEEVTYGQVCYLAAIQQGLIDDDASYVEAFNIMKDRGQLPKSHKYEVNDVIPIVNISFILGQTFDVKGGVMYRLTKGSPRYALKQLKADGVIKSALSPGKTISGMSLFNVFTNCLNVYTDFDIFAISMESEL